MQNKTDLSLSDRRRSSDIDRTLNYLPQHPSTDFSPFPALEFDLSVQEFCKNQSYHITHKASKTSNKSKPDSQSSIGNPFNKLARSAKVIINGDVAVGKTCLVNRFGHNIYSNSYQTTIGVDFDLQKFNILNQPYVLQIWDTAGLERFKCMTSSYYRGCQAALLVFDVSNLTTLANALRWRDEVMDSSKTFDQMALEPYQRYDRGTSNTPLLFLVGTKSDLPISEAVRSFIREQANKIAQILEAELWFVSAQTGHNVNELFNRVAALTFNRCILTEISKIKFETSTFGSCIKEKLLQQQRDLWNQSSKLIKITKKKDGDDRRTRCINIQCVIR